MDKIDTNEVSPYDLESTSIDWASIEAKEESKGRWSFIVDNREVGRRIAYEFAKGLPNPNMAQARLGDPAPVDNLRLDGNQITYYEYDENYGSKGNIGLVELRLNYFADDPEYFGKYSAAIDGVLEKIRLAKEEKSEAKQSV